MKKIISWKLFFILLFASVVVSFMVMPYSLALSQTQIELTPVILLASAIQTIIVFSFCIFFGLLLSERIGMGLPVLQAALEDKRQFRNLVSFFLPAVWWGVLSGILVILLSLPFRSLSVEMLELEIYVAPWKGLLASFYGGIAEEIVFRLFLVSLLVWITTKIIKNRNGFPTNLGVWVSIVLAAILFGLGHLPITGEITTITAVVVIRAILLNSVCAIIFGWLYWKRGLESAMIAHFSADIVLHVITPLIASLFL